MTTPTKQPVAPPLAPTSDRGTRRHVKICPDRGDEPRNELVECLLGKLAGRNVY